MVPNPLRVDQTTRLLGNGALLAGLRLAWVHHHWQLLHQLLESEDTQCSFQVVGEHRERHLALHFGQRAQQKPTGHHCFEVAEGVRRRFTAKPHETGIALRALMGAFDRIGMPGARDAAPFALGCGFNRSSQHSIL